MNNLRKILITAIMMPFCMVAMEDKEDLVTEKLQKCSDVIRRTEALRQQFETMLPEVWGHEMEMERKGISCDCHGCKRWKEYRKTGILPSKTFNAARQLISWGEPRDYQCPPPRPIETGSPSMITRAMVCIQHCINYLTRTR